MNQDNKIRYYINEKQYIPEESALLCCVQNEDFGHSESLYRTQKGVFFSVNENKGCETKVQLMREEEAFKFMNLHTACICLDNYNKVFGEPEKG